MKRIICLILAVISLLIFVACDRSNRNVGKKQSTTETEQQSTTETEQQSILQVNNIFLSRSELTLGVGETVNLVATVSPGNIDAVLTWYSSDTGVASVDENGKVTAKSEGITVIKVQAENGILAVCNVNVKTKSGSVTGEVTFKYNDFVGNRADTGSVVFLISDKTTSLSDAISLGMTYDVNQHDGVYATEVSGSGKYNFENIPVGKYYLVIISENTNRNPNLVSGYDWGFAVYGMFSEKGKENAKLVASVHKVESTQINVEDGKTATFSHDFGITYY